MRQRHSVQTLARAVFSGLLLWLIVGYILYPMAQTVVQSFSTESGFGLAGYRAYFSNPQNRLVIRNTVLVGAFAVLVCGTVGTALAVYMRFLCRRYQKLLHILLLSPVMIPGVIIVIAFIQLYGESGIITKLLESAFHLSTPPYRFSGFGGILFVLAYTQYVYFYLNVYTALRYVDKNVVDSIRSFGGGTFAVIRDAIFPVIRPAIVISALTTFISAISAYSAPSLIGGSFKVLSMQIVKAKANNQMALASIQVAVLLVIGLLMTVVLTHYSKKYAWEISVKSAYFHMETKRASWLRRGLSALVILQVVLVVLPVLAIFYLSFIETRSIMTDIFPCAFTLENYLAIFEKPRVLRPMLNSVNMSLLAVLVGLVLTLPVAYWERRNPTRLVRSMETLLMLPWSMPASVIAINLINVFNVESVFAFGRSLIGTFWILPIAYTIVALPLLLSSNRVAMSGISVTTEEAARSLGAGTFRRFFQIILPNIVSGILSGAILVFVRTMGEYTMSALLYGVYNRPISVSVVTNMQEYKVGISLAYGSLLILLCYGLLWIVLKIDRRRFAME